LYIYHTVSRYLRDQGCEDPWLFFRSQKGSASKNFWTTLRPTGSGHGIRVSVNRFGPDGFLSVFLQYSVLAFLLVHGSHVSVSAVSSQRVLLRSLSKPKGFREQKCFGNTEPGDRWDLNRDSTDP